MSAVAKKEINTWETQRVAVSKMHCFPVGFVSTLVIIIDYKYRPVVHNRRKLEMRFSGNKDVHSQMDEAHARGGEESRRHVGKISAEDPECQIILAPLALSPSLKYKKNQNANLKTFLFTHHPFLKT